MGISSALVANILGSVGTTLLVVAFMLNAIGWIRVSFTYTYLNLIGAGLAAGASLLIQFIPFLVLEGVWFLAALLKLISLYRYAGKTVVNSSLKQRQ